MLAPALIRFKTANPSVIIEMTLADRRVSLIEEGYDLVVRMGPIADSELMSRKIGTLPRVLVASPAFLASHPLLTTPEELGKLPALAIRRDLTGWELSTAEGKKATVCPPIEFAANRQTILVEAAIVGIGIANLPTFMVGNALAAGTLARALPAWTPSPVEMTVLWQRNPIRSRLIKAIVAALTLTCGASDMNNHNSLIT
jgi:DNA-binding transcriptional LysR family regulator